jgi:hypothetical protein
MNNTTDATRGAGYHKMASNPIMTYIHPLKSLNHLEIMTLDLPMETLGSVAYC